MIFCLIVLTPTVVDEVIPKLGEIRIDFRCTALFPIEIIGHSSFVDSLIIIDCGVAVSARARCPYLSNKFGSELRPRVIVSFLFASKSYSRLGSFVDFSCFMIMKFSFSLLISIWRSERYDAHLFMSVEITCWRSARSPDVLLIFTAIW